MTRKSHYTYDWSKYITYNILRECLFVYVCVAVCVHECIRTSWFDGGIHIKSKCTLENKCLREVNDIELNDSTIVFPFSLYFSIFLFLFWRPICCSHCSTFKKKIKIIRYARYICTQFTPNYLRMRYSQSSIHITHHSRYNVWYGIVNGR